MSKFLRFLVIGMLAFTALHAAPRDISKVDRHMALKPVSDTDIVWYDIAATDQPFRLSGLAFFSQNHLYRRLQPVKGLPKGVESLADCTSGVTLGFKTDSSRVMLEVQFTSPYGGMWHMSPVGKSGFDLYTGGPGNWITCGVSRFVKNRTRLFKAPKKGEIREFLLNFPLYNGVKKVRIGLDKGAKVLAPTPYSNPKRIVMYGGSVTQGACASRPGRAFLNIIGRHFNMEVINLGFSGSSRFEPEVARQVAAVDNPAVVIVEGDRNAGFERVRDLEPAFVATIRKRHPGVPIIVMQGNPWWGADLSRPKIIAEQKKFVAEMGKTDPDLHWWDCTDFIGPDHSDCLVDGKHPSDLGFERMAQHIIKLLTPYLTTAEK